MYCGVLACVNPTFRLVIGVSAAVKQSTHNPKFKGLNLAPEKWQKDVMTKDVLLILNPIYY
jgi:hypothetical protein